MAEHGTAARYKHGRCRCDDCRAAKAAYDQRFKRNRLAALASGAAQFEHGKNSSYVHWGCRCRACKAAHNADSQNSRSRAVAGAFPEGKTEHGTPAAYGAYACRCEVCVTGKSKRLRAVQAESERSAKRRGYTWTGPELEVVDRRDLTAREVARILGRTYSAVVSMRAKLRDDPKTINLAGVARGTGESPT